MDFNNNNSTMHTVEDFITAFGYTILGIFASSGFGDLIASQKLLSIPIHDDAHELVISFVKYGLGSSFSVATFICIFFCKRYLEKKYGENHGKK